MEAYEIALNHTTGPSLLALSRQNLLTKRTSAAENLTAKGAYVLLEAEKKRQATLLATGSEVDIAVAAHALLKEAGVDAAVVSMPCWELFEQQDKAYRDAVLGDSPLRVGIEAAVGFGWDRWIGPEGIMVGMPGFGASGKIDQVYAHFGITARAVADTVLKNL
jgi:transketolase